jgi:hypothetical protein
MSTKAEKEKELQELEVRKIKALERIANSLDSLTVWFEEIDKIEWGDRVQYYLAEFHNKIVKGIVYEDGEPIKVDDKTTTTVKNVKKK